MNPIPPIDKDQWHTLDREYKRDYPGGMASLNRDVNKQEWLDALPIQRKT